ncbi:MAG: AAA family ATPase [Thermotogota bacterium]
MKKRIPYGIGDFESIRKENYYYIDKTKIIEELEKHRYPFFIRPRRFGKSLLVSILEDYYDIEKKDQFDELFKGLYIHEHPTPEKNNYLVLRLDFSGIETDRGKAALYRSFTDNVKQYGLKFADKYQSYLKRNIYEDIKAAKDPTQLIKIITTALGQNNQKAYFLIDEYDNFANDLIGANEDDLYYEILSKTGFVRTFYEAIKSGAQEGAISRIFLTGVSPIMLDDLTSGFNIAKNITLDKEFNDSLGFTQAEVETMLNYYNVLEEKEKQTALEDMKQYYNGYLFHPQAKERLYNPDMVLHFMDSYKNGSYPDVMIDMNVKTDYGKIQRLINEDRLQEASKIEQILEEEEIITKLVRMFPLEAITNKDELISLMFYMGMLTIDEPIMANVKLRVPNLVIREIYWEYIYKKVNRILGDTVDIYSITKVTQTMAQTGNPKAFLEYAYDKVIQYISNRDLIKMEEKHIKMIFLSFLTMNQVYIPYSELEMNKGYSDIVLVPDTRYGVKNSQIWELKYIKDKEDPQEKIKEAKKQIKKYEQDEKFQRLAAGTDIYKTIILAYKDKIELLDQTEGDRSDD